jgi:hypothetical protein
MEAFMNVYENFFAGTPSTLVIDSYMSQSEVSETQSSPYRKYIASELVRMYSKDLTDSQVTKILKMFTNEQIQSLIDKLNQESD